MKKNAAILAVLIGAAAFYTGYANERAPAAPVTTAKISALPDMGPAKDFTFDDMSGKKHSLKGFQGQAVLINFWASWCAPCVIEFPLMIKLAQMSPDTRFVFLTWDEEEKEAERFLDKYGKNLPENVIIGFDKDRRIGADYGTKQIPETYLIDPDLQIRGKIIGADVDWAGPAMVNKLTRLQNQ